MRNLTLSILYFFLLISQLNEQNFTIILSISSALLSDNATKTF